MSFEPPAGILDIGNATLRVGKLEVAETSGLNQGLQNIIKNDLLITENNESSPYTTNQKWGLKLPTTWVGEFEVKGHSGKYIDFNFYNENSASNAQGYNLTFKDTTMTLRYDGGNPLGGGAATIPTIVGAFRKVNIFFERGVISVSIDGTRYLYHKETDGFNQGLGVASRVVSATGSAFVNLFIEQNAGDSAFKNLRIVNGRFISDKTSNIAFIGGNLGVGVHSPKESLDILGNMHLTRVSNVSQIKVSSNVVAEYTGPHDRPLRKYPEVALTQNDESATSGYVVTRSSIWGGTWEGYKAFNEQRGTNLDWLSATRYTNGVYDKSEGDTGYAYLQDTNGIKYEGEWITLQLPKSIRLEKFSLVDRDGADFTARLPKDGTLLGSNDGTNWEVVLRWTDRTFITDIDNFFNVNISKYYSHFGLVGEALASNSGSASWDMGEIKYYGYEEGDSSLDTTLKSVYNVPVTTGTQLEVYYDAKGLADGAVTSVTDLSPNTNNGTVSGDPQVSNGAFVFDGTGDYITNTRSGYSSSGTYTVSTWVNISKEASGQTNPNIFQYGVGQSSTTDTGFGLITNSSDDRIQAFVYGNNDFPVYGIKKYGTWIHLTSIYELSAIGTNITLYVNGNNVGSQATSTAAGIGATPHLSIGVQANASDLPIPGTYFNGSIANFRIYNKALNAGQVQELYDYQKDYFLGSKSQVTLYKGHLGVGVTEPSGQLELAGDERIQEYPPRAFDGGAYQQIGPNEVYIEGHGHFKAWSTGNYSGDYEAGSAFTKTSGVGVQDYDRWVSSDNIWTAGTSASSPGTGLPTASAPTFAGYKGAHLILELPYAINLKSFTIGASGSTQSSYNTHVAQIPSVFVIIASNDGNNWDTIFSHTATDGVATDYIDNMFSVNVTKAYSQYGYVALKNGNTNGYFHVTVGEWRLFGTPGPTTLDKGSLTLGRSLDVPRISRYDVDTETPRPEKLVLDLDTTVNSSPTDISGKGNHGRFVGTAQYSPADKAFKFDGDSDYIQGTLNLNGTELNTSYTLSMWVKSDSTANDTAVFMFIGSSGSGDAIGFRHNNNSSSGGTEYLLYHFGILDTSATSQPTNLNQWRHLVAMYDGTNHKIFVDGVLAVTAATSDLNTIPNNPTYSIGYRWNGGLAGEYFDGMVSNPKVYSVALEASEVKKLYNLGRTGRSMVISDTAVGIGKVPEAQLDVRGIGQFGSIYAPGAVIQANFFNGGLGFTTRAHATSGNIGTNCNTGLKLSITPRKSSSTIMCQFNFLYHYNGTNTNGARCQVWRNLNGAYTRVYGTGNHDLHFYDTQSASLHAYLNIQFHDNPNTTQSVEYELRAANYVLPSPGDRTLTIGNGSSQPVTIQLLEIGGE